MTKRFFDADELESSLRRYGVLPVSLWEINYMGSSTDSQLNKLLGDKGSTRPSAKIGWGIGKTFPEKGLKYQTTSVFAPRLCANMLRLFAPKEGVVYDPFAGGGTRAIMAAKYGLDYVGIELRPEEADSVRHIAEQFGVVDRVSIITGDSCGDLLVKPGRFDFCYTCPPYYNLEKYEGGELDISMAETYGDFISYIKYAIVNSFEALKPGARSCWVVGAHRDQDGELLALNHDIAKLHQKAGFIFREEIVIHRKGTPARLRVGTFRKGKHLLVRVHEYCLVFEKPQEKK